MFKKTDDLVRKGVPNHAKFLAWNIRMTGNIRIDEETHEDIS